MHINSLIFVLLKCWLELVVEARTIAFTYTELFEKELSLNRLE